MPIANLLDVDFYKFTMAQVAWRQYRDAQVRFEFFQRDTGQAAPIGTYLKGAYSIRSEVERIRSMSFDHEMLRFLWDTSLFEKDFLDALKFLDLPPVDVNIDPNGNLTMVTQGAWWKVTFWETILLATVNEMYNARRVEQTGHNIVKARADGLYQLQRKAEKAGIWAPSAHITDFGTRRRFSHEWQGFALEILKRELGSEMLVGTSNVFWAKELGLKPVGTYAHEMDMVYAGLYYPIKPSELELAHRYMMRDWENQYPYAQRIGLTDTWGSDFFFRTFSKEQAINWAGVRHDSGNPFQFIETTIRFYQNLGIDPTQKTIIFSDGLDVDTIIKIHEQCFGRIQHGFGWGTDLMNDCGNLPLSLVMKATQVDGNPLVKLSDNLNKAIGSELDIAAYVNMAHYTPQERKELNS